LERKVATKMYGKERKIAMEIMDKKERKIEMKMDAQGGRKKERKKES
jgi:hypothetical protein